VAYRQPSKPRPTRTPVERGRLEPLAPESLEAHSFKIGGDAYVLVSFPIGADGPWIDSVAGLTPTEREIVACVLQGQSNAAIAGTRGTSPRTIANQLAKIYSKLGVRSRRELGAKRNSARKTT
jgi:DNA-binding CsgD family transcriptional regulator